MIIVLNNKNNFTLSEFKNYQDKLSSITSTNDLILCPSNIYLPLFNLNNFHLGSQDVSINKKNSNTGEVTAKQLKSLGVEYTIVGHSERRNYQKETNKDINKKIKNLLEEGITPILCIGETKEENKNFETTKILMKEINECLEGIDEEKVIIAYEPIWSIGTGEIPEISIIEILLNMIKEKLPHNKVIYGGSITEENIERFKKITNLDGYLLGGLSLNPHKLTELLNNLEDN